MSNASLLHSELSVLQRCFLYGFALVLGVYCALRCSLLASGGALFDDDDDDDDDDNNNNNNKQSANDVVDERFNKENRSRRTLSWLNTPRVRRVLHQLCVMGVILCFAFVVEHTDVVPTISKKYDVDDFWFLAGLLLAASLLTIKKSHGSEILNRDQTEEWKGWMQFLFLCKLSFQHFFRFSRHINLIFKRKKQQ